MNSTEIIDKIKEINRIKTDTELAKLADCNKSTVSRWRKKGFHKSTESLLVNLINNYNAKEKSKIVVDRLTTDL